MISIDDIVLFLIGRVKSLRGRPLADITAMVAWHVKGGGVHVVTNDGAIAGVALGRPVRRLCDINRRWAWNVRGNYLCADIVAADSYKVMKRLWWKAARRWGNPAFVIFQRSKNHGRVSVHPFWKLARRLNYDG